MWGCTDSLSRGCKAENLVTSSGERAAPAECVRAGGSGPAPCWRQHSPGQPSPRARLCHSSPPRGSSIPALREQNFCCRREGAGVQPQGPRTSALGGAGRCQRERRELPVSTEHRSVSAATTSGCRADAEPRALAQPQPSRKTVFTQNDPVTRPPSPLRCLHLSPSMRRGQGLVWVLLLGHTPTPGPRAAQPTACAEAVRTALCRLLHGQLRRLGTGRSDCRLPERPRAALGTAVSHPRWLCPQAPHPHL